MNLLLCTDLSKFSETVLSKAKELAMATSAKLWVIHIVSPDQGFIGYEQAELMQSGVIGYKIESQSSSHNIRHFIANKIHNNHRKLQAISSNLREQGLDTTGLMIQGQIVESILKLATKLRIDMIIIGSQQHSIIHQCLLGSISDSLSHKSNIPILMIPKAIKKNT